MVQAELSLISIWNWFCPDTRWPKLVFYLSLSKETFFFFQLEWADWRGWLLSPGLQTTTEYDACRDGPSRTHQPMTPLQVFMARFFSQNPSSLQIFPFTPNSLKVWFLNYNSASADGLLGALESCYEWINHQCFRENSEQTVHWFTDWRGGFLKWRVGAKMGTMMTGVWN